MRRKKEQGDVRDHVDTTDFNVSVAGEESVAEATGATSDAPTQEVQANAAPEKKEDEEQVNMLQVLHNITAEEGDEEEERVPLTLASILGGDILGGKWFRKQFWYMLMLTGMIVVYVANRYACQQEMIQTKVLSDTLLDRRYKALTRSSQLKERTRRSFIEQNLADSALQTAKTPSFNLPVEE